MKTAAANRSLSRLRRSAVALVAVAALATTASACDSSPFAAVVGSATIKQTALNAQLRTQTSNKAYVAAFNQSARQRGQNVSTNGDGTGTYGNAYVASVLSTMVIDAAVHQASVASVQPPAAPLIAAARAVEEALSGSVWLEFPATFRDARVYSDAEHDALEPTTLSLSQLYQAYSQAKAYFFARVCIRQVTVAVANANGSVDQPASLSAATSIASSYNLTQRIPALTQYVGGVSGGAITCYTPAQLEATGTTLFTRVLALGPGQAAAPQRAAYGYNVLAVESRVNQPFGPAVQRALSVIIEQLNGQPDPVLTRLLARTHVKVNQAYGTWDASQESVAPPATLGANSSPAG